MNDKAFGTLGKRIAALEFDRRSKGRPYRTTEAHVREVELAALLALAVEEGYKRGLAEGNGEDHPQGVVTAHGRLVALKPPVEGVTRAGPSDADVLAIHLDRQGVVGATDAVLVDRNGGRPIAEAAAVVLPAQYETVTVQSNGTEWKVDGLREDKS